MSILKRRKVVVLGVTLSLVLGAGLAAAAQKTFSAASLTRVTVVTEDAPKPTITETTFKDFATSVISASGDSHILVRFSAESACYGGSGYCTARILVDGGEADPKAGEDFRFDSTDNNTATSKSLESHSMERVRTVKATADGTHTIQVQVAVKGVGVNWDLDDWTLSAWALAP
ncbi:hypothetical protein DMH04_38135 [Kibdelosporangium aridum]|uniref:PLAT domain-containing protein n=1 Tax=Kibdelosporangium aridum TaxID=2030 RepID=A0A428YY73_KIBAR|nr:hypothetical protein [Kibdelosporangium aridum]RSM75546.1 hypothetical protein DMH04_38135 [Kibdelosporangium aridum]